MYYSMRSFVPMYGESGVIVMTVQVYLQYLANRSNNSAKYDQNYLRCPLLSCWNRDFSTNVMTKSYDITNMSNIQHLYTFDMLSPA